MSSLKTSVITLTIFFGISLLAAFTQATVPQLKPTRPADVTLDSLNEQTQLFVFFYTKTFLKRDRTQIIIPYAYDQNQPILFVGFSPDNQQERTLYLVSHPQIADLNWPSIKSGNLTLYQKQKQFNTLDEFVAASIDLKTIAVDPEVKNNFPNLKQAENTDQLLDLDQINFILTNYIPSSQKNGIFYYKNVIDATTASVNDNNEIEWFIKSTTADPDNPYKLGNISIDYLQ